MTLVIGFGYKARHGKDTAAQAILEARGKRLDIRRYGFADALKAEVAGREQELCREHGIKYEPENKHRALLQWYGTEFRRAQDHNYWVKQLAARIAREQPDVALITDMRFRNEADYVKEAGGFTIKVTRIGFADAGTNSAHASERDLDGYPFDFVLSAASGDVAGLRREAVGLFDMLAAKTTTDYSSLPLTAV